MLFTPVASRLNRPALHSFERFLDDVVRASHSQPVQQDEKAYRLSFDVPGISREQLHIEIEDNQVRAARLPWQLRTAPGHRRRQQPRETGKRRADARTRQTRAGQQGHHPHH